MSLKKAAKERLLWAIRQVVLPFGKLIMVVDAKTLRIISSCCLMSDIIDEGVELVELINKKRQPMRSKVALYVLSDDVSSVDLLINDFRPGEEMYSSVFIMFNCHLLNDVELRKIAESISMARILGCVELHMNFVPYEEKVFHGFLGSTLFQIYPRYSRNIVESISSRLASLCSILNICPKIRFQRSQIGISEAVARSAFSLIESLQPPEQNNGKSDDYLIILERSIDFTPLFIHEYTYQAFVYDMLHVPCCTDYKENRVDDSWEFKLVTNAESNEVKTAILSTATDQLWERYRHMHIQQVNSNVLREIKQFSKDKDLGGNIGTNMDKKSVTNTLNLVRKLPQVQYLLEKYWAHINISEKCFEVVEAKNMVEVGSIEQTIATNIDKHGKHASHTKTFQQLISILDSHTIDEEQKIRLMLLYACNYKNVSRTQIERLITEAHLSIEGNKILEKYLSLFINDDEIKDGINEQKIVHRIESMSDIKNFYKKRIYDSEYDLSRYVPEIIHIIKRFNDNKLKEELFPHISPAQAHNEPEDNEHAYRNTHDDENDKWGFDPTTYIDGEKTKPKLVVYIVGGITFSEMREIHNLNTNYNLFLGGDHIIVPSNIINVTVTE